MYRTHDQIEYEPELNTVFLFTAHSHLFSACKHKWWSARRNQSKTPGKRTDRWITVSLCKLDRQENQSKLLFLWTSSSRSNKNNTHIASLSSKKTFPSMSSVILGFQQRGVTQSWSSSSHSLLYFISWPKNTAGALTYSITTGLWERVQMTWTTHYVRALCEQFGLQSLTQRLKCSLWPLVDMSLENDCCINNIQNLSSSRKKANRV